MSGRLIALVATTAGFGVLSALAVLDVGYVGVIEPLLTSWGGAQVFVDLVIALVLITFWMADDARSRGIPLWPFIAVTLALGSFGPLLYLIARELRAPAAQPAAPSPRQA